MLEVGRYQQIQAISPVPAVEKYPLTYMASNLDSDPVDFGKIVTFAPEWHFRWETRSPHLFASFDFQYSQPRSNPPCVDAFSASSGVR
jgi:hypothetical protein